MDSNSRDDKHNEAVSRPVIRRSQYTCLITTHAQNPIHNWPQHPVSLGTKDSSVRNHKNQVRQEQDYS